MKIQVRFISDEIKGKEIGEIHEEELRENLITLLTRFLAGKSLVYGREIDSWEVRDDRLRLCIDEESKDITCYTCDVDAELVIRLTVTDKQILTGDHWSTNLLRGIIEAKRKGLT